MNNRFLFRFLLFVFFILSVVLIFPQDKLIWDEDFSSNKNGWFVDKFVNLNNGKYVLFNENNDCASWRTTQDKDYKIRVESTWKGGKDNFGYGLIFRFQNQQSYYLYWISGNGYYIAGKIGGTSFTPFIKWSPSSNINKNGTNLIEVELRGEEIKGFINGKLLFTQKDSSYLKGGFGFYSQKGVNCEFDNLKVWEYTSVTKLKQNAWNLVETKVYKKGYDVGSGLNIAYSGKDGAMTIDYSEKIAGFKPKRVVQSWSWSKLPDIIDPNTALYLSVSGKQISKSGDINNFGWFIADIVFHGTDTDSFPMPGYGHGDDITLGYNNTASGKPGNHYSWISYPKGEIKTPKGIKDQIIAVRVSFQAGSGAYCGYYYIYKWVD